MRTSSEVSRDGRGLQILLSSTASNSAVAVIDCVIPAGAAGPPLHVHPESDETFVVLSGALLVHLGGEVNEIGAGEVAHVRRGAAHTFATGPGAAAHFLTVHTPGGFEQFHVAAAEAEADRGSPLAPAELIGIARDFDWQLAGPPMLPSGALAF